MKKRFLAAAICFLILSFTSMYAAYNIDCFLRQDLAACSIIPFTVFVGAWQGKARLFTLLFLTLSVGGILFLLLVPEYIQYKSNMMQIVPGVRTPEAAGQGQYGTARWMTAAEKSTAFAAAQIDSNSELIADLLEHGYDDAHSQEKEVDQ